MESPPKKGRLKRAMTVRLLGDVTVPGRGALAMMSSLTLAAFLASLLPFSSAADLVIRFPGDLSQQDGFYRLYYTPEVGSPQVSVAKGLPDMMSASEGGGGSWKSRCSKVGSGNFIV